MPPSPPTSHTCGHKDPRNASSGSVDGTRLCTRCGGYCRRLQVTVFPVCTSQRTGPIRHCIVQHTSTNDNSSAWRHHQSSSRTVSRERREKKCTSDIFRCRMLPAHTTIINTRLWYPTLQLSIRCSHTTLVLDCRARLSPRLILPEGWEIHSTTRQNPTFAKKNGWMYTRVCSKTTGTCISKKTGACISRSTLKHFASPPLCIHPPITPPALLRRQKVPSPNPSFALRSTRIRSQACIAKAAPNSTRATGVSYNQKNEHAKHPRLSHDNANQVQTIVHVVFRQNKHSFLPHHILTPLPPRAYTPKALQDQ